jgi:hypothetical protein
VVESKTGLAMSLARLLVIMTLTAMHSKLATSHVSLSMSTTGKEMERQTIQSP